MRIKKYRIGVSLKTLYVAATKIPPMMAGKTSSNHINESCGCMPDQIKPVEKIRTQIILMTILLKNELFVNGQTLT
jgi:hypothetical protein